MDEWDIGYEALSKEMTEWMRQEQEDMMRETIESMY